jgi:TRAP-type transport system periplasmic protein
MPCEAGHGQAVTGVAGAKLEVVKYTRRGAIALLGMAVAIAGCGFWTSSGGAPTSSDKAGGTPKVEPVVLTMIYGNDRSQELDAFAAAVARLSGGTLRIAFHSDWRRGSRLYENAMVRDVQSGRLDLAVVGTRAWKSLGVASFDALHAPLLVDNFALEERVLQSPLADRMLAGLKPLGIAALGILPGPMRKPLGVSPLVRPADYRGKTLAISRSSIATQTLRALDAKAHEIGRPFLEGVDGIEQQVASIDATGTDKAAKYLTANVNLWPASQVVFMSKPAFAALEAAQRRALTAAARSALPAMIAFQRGDESFSAGNLCRRGLTFLTATDADLADLRRAVQPVYDRLAREAQTRSAIEQIRQMRTGAATIADAPACSPASAQAETRTERTPIDGVYRQHTTARDLRSARTPEGDVNPGNYGTLQTVLDRGRFTQTQSASGIASGTYTVAGYTLTMSYPNGELFTFHWSLYRGLLTLEAAPGKTSPAPMLARPWRRTGDAP